MEIPRDFKPSFAKGYNLEGKQIAIEVDYKGERLSRDTWHYTVVDDKEIIDYNTYSAPSNPENPYDRKSNEQAADAIAEFLLQTRFKKGRGEYTAILLFKDPIEKARTLVWREYYMDGVNTLPIEKVRVIQFSQMLENCWIATVAVDKKEDDRNYKVRYDSPNNMIRVDVYIPIEGFNIPL